MNRLFTCQVTDFIVAFCAVAAICVRTYAAQPQGIRKGSIASNEAAIAGAEGRVLAGSYHYHRRGEANGRQSHPTIAPAAGWYGYGFPVQTYRWGWFGAERYYPRVVWHRGYYGDCCRWAYRHGY